MIDEKKNRRRFVIIVLMTAISLISIYVFTFIFHVRAVFTHLFYIPIILAALWWGWKGVSVALVLSTALIGATIAVQRYYSFDDFLRAGVLVLISAVVALLAERFSSERERAKHLNRVLRAVREINHLITKEHDRDRFIRAVCGKLVENRSYGFAWIALFDEETRLVGSAEAGLGQRFYPMVEMLKYGTLPHCARRTDEWEGMAMVRDPEFECAGCPLAVVAADDDDSTGRMTVFINTGKRLKGILSVAAPEGRVIDDEERSLFEEIAEDVEYALAALELRGAHEIALEELQESEERFRSIVENAPFGYYRIDAEGRFVYVNPEWERVLGFKNEEVVGRHFSFIQQDRRDEYEENISRVLRGETVRGEVSLRRKDGEISFHTFTGQPVYSRGGIIGGEWFLNDITDRKQIERALQRSERLTAEIIEGSPIPIFVIDKDHVLTHWNRACEMLTGVSSEEMIGTKRQWEPFYPAQRPTMADMILDIARDSSLERIYEGEFRWSSLVKGAGYAERFFPHLGQEGQWLYFTAAPLRDTEGEIIGAIETLQDVTVRKKAEEERVKAYVELEQLFNATPVGIRVIDRDFRTVHLNWRFMEMFGLDSTHFGGSDLFLRNREIIRTDRILMKRILAGEKYTEYEFRTTVGDADMICVVYATPYYSQEGEIIGVIENFTNITEMRRLQDGIMRIAELERQRIGQDLHDGLGQNLTAVTFLIEALKERMAASYPDGVPVIENIENMVRSAIVQTRGLSRMLSPVEMERNGLISALDEMAASTEKIYRVSCRVMREGNFFVSDGQAATHLFYIAREAVTNAIKHGKAGSIVIRCIDGDGEKMMIIRDDGIGAPANPADTGLGLRIMRYRSEIIGAEFSAGNREQGGFEVVVKMRG